MNEDCFRHDIKMECQKITNLLGNLSDKVPRFITKKMIEVHDQSANAENRYNPNKQIRFKKPMLRSDYVTTVMHILFLKEKLLLQIQIMMQMHMTRNYLFQKMHHLLAAFQKLIIHLLIMQRFACCNAYVKFD